MSELAIALIELAAMTERDWSELSADERAALDDWAIGATGRDVYLLLHEAARRRARPRRSSSQTLSAIRETADEADRKDD